MAPLVVSLGDPAGIGSELIAEGWTRRKDAALPPFVVTGGVRTIEMAAASRSLACPVLSVGSLEEGAKVFTRALPVLEVDVPEPNPNPGRPSQAGAHLALASLELATKLCLSGQAAGLVTGPVAKGELGKIGFEFAGQTEFVAARCGKPARDAVMMLAETSLRTVPLTVHCPLADVPGLLSLNLIMHKARIVAEALRHDFGIKQPRIAVAGLNPHAGEGGKFGSEEQRIIAPAVAALREEGLDITGPYPGDALFTPRARTQYDVALCMYHDQALIPLKALAFDEGVNVTLGLPIVRTSPDHGTAFDIAGQGIADPGATIAAIRMADDCARRRFNWSDAR